MTVDKEREEFRTFLTECLKDPAKYKQWMQDRALETRLKYNTDNDNTNTERSV
tara:strand:- start:463 stop:621 length:159 start_codon:yes stop_codon:yes gene_type:complete